MTVHMGAWRWPRRTIPLTEIQAARAIVVVPLAYGGWGWRRRPGRTAVIVRGGPAIDYLATNPV